MKWLVLMMAFAVTIVSVAPSGVLVWRHGHRSPSMIVIGEPGTRAALPPAPAPVATSSPRPMSALALKIEQWNTPRAFPSASDFHPAIIELGSNESGPAVTVRDGGFEIAMEGSAARFPTAPAIYQNLIFVGGGLGKFGTHFYAFDAHTGEQKWAVDLGDDGAYAPACADGVCAFTTESCSLYVVDAATGKPLWGKYLAPFLYNSPAIAHGKVFASYRRFPSPSRNPRSLFEQKQFAAGPQAAVAAFDLKKGTLSWQRWTEEDALVALLVKGDTLLTPGYRTLVQFDAATGTLRSARQDRFVGFGVALPAVRGKARAREILRSTSSLESIDSASGKSLWAVHVDGPSEPIVVGDTLLVGTAGGELVQLSQADGSVLHHWDTGAAVVAQPVADSGWIYAATEKGVVAVNTGDPAITGWSQWGGDAAHSRAVLQKRTAQYVDESAGWTPLQGWR